MALPSGTRLGLYEVVAPLGAGGMGEVYRARDTKLGRSVAVKVLPDAVAKDHDRIARFEREAKALAALNHPHIATLYGLEEVDGRHLLIMELVEGETLAERLAGAPLPLEETIRIARQIAEALEAAHEKGIVHRDLKPANVKLTPDDNVKVLDFGLAKAMDPAQSGEAANSPTLSVMATGAGMILGTAAYMSPEQAKGNPTDTRSDVFSFGSVLYEMLTGRPAFTGESVADILASVLAREPDYAAVPANLNPRLDVLLERCLEKSRRQRWQAIGDVRAELEAIAKEPRARPAATIAAAPPPPLWKRALPGVALALLLTIAQALVVWRMWPTPAPGQVVRYSVVLGPDEGFANTNRQTIAVSPDGRNLVYAAAHGQRQQLYVRPTDRLDAQPIPGTDTMGALSTPVFAPDGSALVFWSDSDSTIKRIGLAGGAAITVCPADQPQGMSWSGDSILYSTGLEIMRVPAGGGKPETVVTVKEPERVYGARMLPDGETLLYTLGKSGQWNDGAAVVHSLRTGVRREILDSAYDAQYVPSGHIVFAQGGVLHGIKFDRERLATVGGAVPVVEGVRRAIFGTTPAVHIAYSANGTLAYLPGSLTGGTATLQLATVTRTGGATPLKVPAGPYSHPRLSPDGRHVAMESVNVREGTIWVYDMTNASALRRLTFGGRYRYPIWTADSRRIVFSSDRDADRGLHWQRADGLGTMERLTTAEPGSTHVPQGVSPDGASLLLDLVTPGRFALMVLSMKDRTLTTFGAVESSVPTGAIFSPDGKWVAYTSRRLSATSGGAGVFVQPFPATGTQYQISRVNEDGHHPVWSRDRAELFYTPGPGNRLQAVRVTMDPAFAMADPVTLPRPFTNAPPAVERTYDVTRDGGFLGLQSQDSQDNQTWNRIMIVMNWFDDLKTRIP